MLIWVVDVIVVAASDMEATHDIKQMLQEKVHMKDLRRLSYFPGIYFEQGNGSKALPKQSI